MAKKNGHVKRRNTYTIFEETNVKWHWDMKDIWAFDEMADNGAPLDEIAKYFKIPFDDAVLIASDRIRRGKIKKRLKVALV